METEELIGIAYNRGLRPRLETDVLGARVVWEGGRLSPALARVLALPCHAGRLVELVGAAFSPPLSEAPTVPNSGRQRTVLRSFFPDGTDFHPDRWEPLPGTPDFDHGAENAVKALYSAGVGLVPRIKYCGKEVNPEPVVTWECRIGRGFSARAGKMAIEAVRPLRDRIVSHLTVRPSGEWTGKGYEAFDPHGGNYVLEFRVRNYPDGHHLRIWRELWGAREVRHPFCRPLGTRFDAWRWTGETFWRAPWGRWTASDDDDRLVVWKPWGV